jgi:indole-3-glycerol phosphate synthase
MMTILDRIVEYKREEEIPRRLKETPLQRIQEQAATAPPPRDLLAALRSAAPEVALIAEVKRASPSKGVLRHDLNPIHLATEYSDHGAAAISVLTDERFFQGDIDHLKQIRSFLDSRLISIPLLRKDFIIHPYQVYEARAAGADALLLIASILSDGDLASLLSITRTLGMTALIEVRNEKELSRVMPHSPRLVGVNNRDLRDFSVNLETCLDLRAQVPREVCLVAESGIHTGDDVRRLRASGVDAFLVGEALVTAPDAGAKVQELIGASQS